METMFNSWNDQKNNLQMDLYTWIDVQESIRVFQNTREGREWFNGKSVRAYWDGLFISVAGTHNQEVISSIKTVLSEIFLARYVEFENVIILGAEPFVIRFPVIIENEDSIDDINEEQFLGTFSSQRFISNAKKFSLNKTEPQEGPVLLAFHSFKGGVGRTLHAIALAIDLQKKGEKVLLIDADFEAPGISWCVSNPTISFADFIAMAHGDSGTYQYTLENVKKQILNNALNEDLFILPAFRDANQFGAPIIKPEHLSSSKTPFLLQDLVLDLGKSLNVDYIIIDLRAGVSELSAGWLLDPKVFKVIVTTLASQSLRGCRHLIDKIEETYNKFEIRQFDSFLLPFIIFSQVPVEIEKSIKSAWGSSNNEFENDFDMLKSKYINLFSFKNNEDDSFPAWVSNALFSIEYSNLKNISSNWQEITKRIEESTIFEKISLLHEWIPSSNRLMSLTPPQADSIHEQESLDKQRQRLADISDSLITADSTTDVEDFLVTQSIEKLVDLHVRTIPIVIIIGAKGSGKTYLFRVLSRYTNWEDFVLKVRTQNAKDVVRARFQRVTLPANLADFTFEDVIKPFILEQLREANFTTSEWRLKWLDVIAWANGISIGVVGAWTEFYSQITEPVVCLFDGLEELFLSYHDNNAHQTALRSLLQDVPNWLESLPTRKIGMITFIREDIVNYVIPQNTVQFLSKHRSFQLKWSEEEALRLALWVAKKANVIDSPKNPKDLGKAELESTLYRLWGQRLGNNTSREARTSNWVLGALSNFQDEVQSRDIVRFLYFASIASKDDSAKRFYLDRILIPTSIKSSIGKVGGKKLEELYQENKPLYDVLIKIRDRSEIIRFPCAKSDLDVFLTESDQNMLEINGVLKPYKNEYYLAEIYRKGLGVKYSKIGKPKSF